MGIHERSERARDRRILACAFGFLSLALAVAVGCASDPPAAPPGFLVEGDALPAIALEDQYGEVHRIDPATRLLIFSRDMDAGDVVEEVLEPLGEAGLRSRAAVYVSDISRMPAFISKTVAIPRMRKRSYPTLLDLSSEATARIPSEAGKATLLRLEALRIEAIRHLDSADELRDALGE